MQERMDQLDEWISNLDGVDMSALEDAEAEQTKEEEPKDVAKKVDSETADDQPDEDDEDTKAEGDTFEDLLQAAKDAVSGVDPGIS